MSLNLRKSLVPWLSDPDDLDEGRRCCWEIEYRLDEDKAMCFPVSLHDRESYLVLHATKPDSLTIALSDSPRYDVYAQDTFRLAHRAPKGDL